MGIEMDPGHFKGFVAGHLLHSIGGATRSQGSLALIRMIASIGRPQGVGSPISTRPCLATPTSSGRPILPPRQERDVP
jgi:hypothetical protein